MRAPENRRAQKNAPSASVVAGDWVYRPGADGREYVMIVDHVGRGVYKGIDAFSYRGDVYTMTGEGAGPQAKFLGSFEAHLSGASEWYYPVDKDVTIGCALGDGDDDPANWGLPPDSD
jgi:type 1 glutamine amidotransferase